MWEVDHVARSFDAIDAAARDGDAYDVVHDHTGFAALAMANRIATPMVHTLHGPFEPDLFALLRRPWRQGAAGGDQRRAAGRGARAPA